MPEVSDDILFEEEPHTYTFRGKRYDSVSQVIRKAGLGQDFSRVRPDLLEYKRRLGKMVHLATLYFDLKCLKMESVDPAIRGHVTAYMRFRNDKPFKLIQSEKMLLSTAHCMHAQCRHPQWEHDKSRMRGCTKPKCPCKQFIGGIDLAGTPDLIVMMDGYRTIIDKKSGGSHPSMGLQTIGYKKLWEALHPFEPIRRRYGLHLGDNGKYKLIPHEDPDDARAFDDALAHAHSVDRMERWAKYAA